MSGETAMPTVEQLQRLRADREVAVLQKFLSGCALSADEMSAVQHLLPIAVLAQPPEPKPDYAYAYDHYASALGCDVRNIKRLVGIGRAVRPADFPPFDRPGDFLAWWRRHMHRDPSERVLAFARPAAGSPPAASRDNVVTTPPSVPPPPPAAPAPPSPLRFEDVGAGGFEAAVRELRSTLATAQSRQKRAMLADPLDEGLVASCTTAVNKQLDLLRKAENDLFDMQQKRGNLVPRSEVREDWRTLLAALRQMRRRMEDNIIATLAKSGIFTPPQLELVRAAVGDERAREDQLLRGSKYWRTDVPANAAA